jgi:hypothetical protein
MLGFNWITVGSNVPNVLVQVEEIVTQAFPKCKVSHDPSTLRLEKLDGQESYWTGLTYFLDRGWEPFSVSEGGISGSHVGVSVTALRKKLVE